MPRRIVATSLAAFMMLSLVAPVLAADVWRSATEKELSAWVPAQAVVVKERIETESRTASGIVDNEGRYVAGVVLITAGYSANGKYSDLLITQVPLKIGTASLQPGEYVFGWHHVDDSLQVLFYEATSGRFLGEVQANLDETHRRIQSLQILPPSEHSLILIGRFGFHYELSK